MAPGCFRLVGCASLAALSSLTACAADGQVKVPAPNYEGYKKDVYPVMLRDCAFPACHGDAGRPLRLYGPGRVRLEPFNLHTGEGQTPHDGATEDEIIESYDRTRSMLLHDGDVLQSRLLTKPLDGYGHAGVDALGRNVYPDEYDWRYQKIRDWALYEELWQ